ncbi:MAG: NPP1 family protein [Sphingomonas sp.]|uniref:NPP1 family protein n=1 Tax=unclassified Sphingomonas TaxID=196159 RepID=UPI0024552751|nr:MULTISPECIES: NPP1 family protein [unclassified Sphingomonas]MBQ1499054.1 NPP1 family protein [Sphingomonas sp.]MDH4745846.1 NPP1 family protein [Sphingomonas sp. CBMAI 2297]
MENQLQTLNGSHEDRQGARMGFGALPVRSLAIAAFGALMTLLPQAAQAQGWPAPVAPLPELATALDKRFQPAIDFDTDVCFNVPAVNAAGAISAGASTYATRPPASCRNPSYRTTSNVYVRARCNNGYCARVYSYFWQSDFSHAYDWESIIVWTTDQGTSSTVVGVTRGDHGGWETRATSGGQLRFQSDSTGQHVKMVYHYETWGFSHLWRFSKTDNGDEPPENGTGQWLIQPLISWNGYPSASVRNAISNYNFGSGNFDNKDARFSGVLAATVNTSITPGFNPNLDSGPNSPGCPAGSTIC